MAKKKKKDEDQDVPASPELEEFAQQTPALSVAEAESEPDASVAMETAPAATVLESSHPLLKGLDDHYGVGSWGGHEKLECAHCPWNTLGGAEQMHAHLFARHLQFNGELRQVEVIHRAGSPEN